MSLPWGVRRLRAMSVSEIVHRIEQKRLWEQERKDFSDKKPVFAVGKYNRVPSAMLARFGLNLENDEFAAGSEIELLGSYPYEEYRASWHAAFQNVGDWPMRFAADYSFGADNALGDIRTNWELNRHHQFAVLAKSFCATCDRSYLDELSFLFEDWNTKNPFMWGPEWSSPMEESIRLINWLAAAAFLESSCIDEVKVLRDKMCSGAWVMAAHVRLHYSRFSSANNHTIIEAAGVAIAAALFGQRQWLREALHLIESEVVLQTHPDGVNKEQALHYELFIMEALCLVAHVLQASGDAFSEVLAGQIRSMARYARACYVGDGRFVEFGDDDEGIIFNLASHKPSYPEYVLSLASLEIGSNERLVEDICPCETIRWLYTNERLGAVGGLPLAELARIESFQDGGVTFLRGDGGRVVLAFDHGPLGFGALAAHGHADALSVQLFVDGESILIDPGTYVYNGNRAMRDLFRSTKMHNTVCIDGRDQSEMLGPFLWGRKAEVSDFELKEDDSSVVRLGAVHDGYAPTLVERTIEFGDSKVILTDEVVGLGVGSAISYLHVPLAGVKAKGSAVELALGSGAKASIETSAPIEAEPFQWSPRYGVLSEGTELAIPFSGALTTTITITRGEQ